MNKEPGTELNSAFLETKEREDWERLNQKFSNEKQQEKKRDEKAVRKAGINEQQQQDKIEKASARSEDSKISRSTNQSFGNALKGMPGTVFEVESVRFTVLYEMNTGGNRMVQCQCSAKMGRDKTKRHTQNTKH